MTNCYDVCTFKCDECGIEFIKQRKWTKKKYHFCSRKCSNFSQKCGVSSQQVKKTCKEKYGYEFPQQNEEVREKTKNTCLEKYGTTNSRAYSLKKFLEERGLENSSQLPDHKDKVKRTSQEKYGTDHPFSSGEVKEKTKQANRAAYGVDWYTQSEDFKRKVDWQANATKRHATMKANNQYSSSKKEDEFYIFLCNSFGIEAVERRKIISGREIDFYIASINTYIQFDGVYWHGLNRSIEQIREFKSPRDKIILGTIERDKKQNETFVQRGLMLVRVTDREFELAKHDPVFADSIIERIRGKRKEEQNGNRHQQDQGTSGST
jgi:hypothetical protein